MLVGGSDAGLLALKRMWSSLTQSLPINFVATCVGELVFTFITNWKTEESSVDGVLNLILLTEITSCSDPRIDWMLFLIISALFSCSSSSWILKTYVQICCVMSSLTVDLVDIVLNTLKKLVLVLVTPKVNEVVGLLIPEREWWGHGHAWWWEAGQGPGLAIRTFSLANAKSGSTGGWRVKLGTG